jgi:transposase
MRGSACKVIEAQHASTAAETYFRVALWIAAQRELPTARRIEQKFDVHRSTACRWLNAWKSATGVVA